MDRAEEPTPDDEGTGAGEGAAGGGPVGEHHDRPDGVHHPEGDVNGPPHDVVGGSPEATVVDNEHEIDDDRDPLRFNRWMKRSATGAVMTGISLGLREALEHKKNQPGLMIEASGQPEDPDHPIRLHFDPDSPADSVAVIRRPAEPDDTPPNR